MSTFAIKGRRLINPQGQSGPLSQEARQRGRTMPYSGNIGKTTMTISKIDSEAFVAVAKGFESVAKREGKLKEISDSIRDEKRDIVREKLAWTIHSLNALSKKEFTILKKHQVDDLGFSQNQVDKYSACANKILKRSDFQTAAASASSKDDKLSIDATKNILENMFGIKSWRDVEKFDAKPEIVSDLAEQFAALIYSEACEQGFIDTELEDEVTKAHDIALKCAIALDKLADIGKKTKPEKKKAA